MRAVRGRIRFLFTMMIAVYMQYKCNIRGEYHEAYSCKYKKDFSGYANQIIIPINPSIFNLCTIKSIQYSFTLSARRTQTLESDLLALNNKALVWALCHRKRYFRKAVCIAASCTGEMRMALALGAVVG